MPSVFSHDHVVHIHMVESCQRSAMRFRSRPSRRAWPAHVAPRPRARSGSRTCPIDGKCAAASARRPALTMARQSFSVRLSVAVIIRPPGFTIPRSGGRTDLDRRRARPPPLRARCRSARPHRECLGCGRAVVHGSPASSACNFAAAILPTIRPDDGGSEPPEARSKRCRSRCRACADLTAHRAVWHPAQTAGTRHPMKPSPD